MCGKGMIWSLGELNWCPRRCRFPPRLEVGVKEKTKNSVQTLQKLTHKDTPAHFRDKSGEWRKLSEGTFGMKPQIVTRRNSQVGSSVLGHGGLSTLSYCRRYLEFPIYPPVSSAAQKILLVSQLEHITLGRTVSLKIG